jgi:hypothetical protein
VRPFIEDHITQEKTTTDGVTHYELAGCPFDRDAHPTENKGYVTVFADGNIAPNCQKAGCKRETNAQAMRDFLTVWAPDLLPRLGAPKIDKPTLLAQAQAAILAYQENELKQDITTALSPAFIEQAAIVYDCDGQVFVRLLSRLQDMGLKRSLEDFKRRVKEASRERKQKAVFDKMLLDSTAKGVYLVSRSNSAYPNLGPWQLSAKICSML